jgi:RimJ/RimL family protein N-acetyltransferase
MPDVSFTELAGRRVVVRRFRPQDVAEFVAYRSDAQVARYQSWDVPYPPEEGERFVAWSQPRARRAADLLGFPPAGQRPRAAAAP